MMNVPGGTVGFAAGVVTGCVVVATFIAWGSFHLPAPVEAVPVFCDVDTAQRVASDRLTVLVWNVQYGASTRHHFFYDGGQAVRVPAQDVSWTLDQIVETVARVDPDIVLWQEVDRGSDRTGRVDQLSAIAAALGHGCRASTPYHRVAYLPFPGHEHLGRVDMQLAVTSKVALADAERHALALMDEPWWRRMFNLRRAALEVSVPTADGTSLRLINTHLSAFSHGDGTLPRQLTQIRDLAVSAEERGDRVLLAGDLNALPPGDDPQRLPEADRSLYADAGSPISVLYDALVPSLSIEDLRNRGELGYTYVPYQGRPDRTIDHAFVAGGIRVESHEVLRTPPGMTLDLTRVSDHLPIVLQLRVLPSATP
jgi:endonuclease/exonuclease/phosphatase family metal-dependent hydrolase